MNLRVKERENLELSVGWLNNPDFFDEYEPLVQMSKTDLQKLYDNKSQDEVTEHFEGITNKSNATSSDLVTNHQMKARAMKC